MGYQNVNRDTCHFVLSINVDGASIEYACKETINNEERESPRNEVALE